MVTCQKNRRTSETSAAVGSSAEEACLPILELNAVSKQFGAIPALNEVDMALEAGEVLGLMGDNGAGKSTLVKVIAGNFPPTHGEIRLDGEPVRFHRPVEAREKG